jgi:hypothetical protein
MKRTIGLLLAACCPVYAASAQDACLTWTNDAPPGGVLIGDDTLGINEWQLPQGLGGGNPLNPIPDFYVFEYSVTDPDARAITYTSLHEDVFLYSVPDGSWARRTTHITPTTFRINIPAPSRVTMLGLGGLLAVHHRQRASQPPRHELARWLHSCSPRALH